MAYWGSFKVGGFLFGFAPFPVSVGSKTYFGAKVGTRARLGAMLVTRACLGRVAAWLADVPILRAALPDGIEL